MNIALYFNKDNALGGIDKYNYVPLMQFISM